MKKIIIISLLVLASCTVSKSYRLKSVENIEIMMDEKVEMSHFHYSDSCVFIKGYNYQIVDTIYVPKFKCERKISFK